MKLNCGAERHHYSMLDIGCSMFIFHNSLVLHKSTPRTTQYNLAHTGHSLSIIPQFGGIGDDYLFFGVRSNF